MLKITFIEEFTSAEILSGMDRKKSAVILLSKALFAVCDYIIWRKYKKLPKNHSERFRILELKEPELYRQIDDVWVHYTDTYSKPSSEESYPFLHSAISTLCHHETIDQEIRAAVEKK